MTVTYELGEEIQPSTLITEIDVVGLFPERRAAAGARWTSTIHPDGTIDASDD